MATDFRTPAYWHRCPHCNWEGSEEDMMTDLSFLDQRDRQRESVTIGDGRLTLWVWELLTGEWACIRQASKNPGPLGGIDEDAALISQIVFSCHEGPEDGSPLLFGDAKGHARIRNLKRGEFQAIMDAFNKVNGTDPAEVEEEKAFFAPSEESRNGSSEPSASVASAV